MLAILVYSNGRTYYNEEDEIGNTPGNLYNGGLFCEKDGKIFFSNDAADGKLYVMNLDCSNIKKIYDDKAVFINADGNYIYYVRANNTRENSRGSIMMFYNTGVFRLKYNGSNLIAYTGNPGAYLMLHGNHLYFQRYDAHIGLYLYRYKIDGKEERLLLEDAVIPVTVQNNSLLYTGYANDHNINAMDLKSFTSHTSIEGNIAYPIITEDAIYYINMDDNYHIYRMNPDGSDPEPVIKKRCSTYNITNDGRYLFYQVDDTKHNGINRYELETGKNDFLMDGDFKQIHVTTNYVFFKDFDNTNTYIIGTGAGKKISTFNPPDLDAPDTEK
jgi:hypothetical protein